MQRLMSRILPIVNDEDAPYWKGGVDGSLHFPQCQSCGYILHPPSAVCPQCHSRDLKFITVSGLGVIRTFTINHHPWIPDVEVPYVIAIVALEEQEDLCIMTNIINIDPDKVTIGMKVRVRFEACEDDIYLPLFEPMD